MNPTREQWDKAERALTKLCESEPYRFKVETIQPAESPGVTFGPILIALAICAAMILLVWWLGPFTWELTS